MSAPVEGEHIVRISRTADVSLNKVWQVLSTPAGTAALLGDGAILGGKGEPWHAKDGSHGVVRSYHPLEQIRVSWHESADDPAHLVDLHLAGDNSSTRLDITHDRVGADADDAAIEDRWSQALERVLGLARS